MRALMANDMHHGFDHGPMGFMRRHSRVIRNAALLAFAFALGAAWQNGRATSDALQGQAHYFVHHYAPAVAAKAAGDALRKTCPDGQ